eukprot:TRINITY_DN83177_c0_g1_i1.p1 TRINITY_DN83177_c0_g1~~TRINITY_DN83177_c0_g1_i1.p1  ORF type:complete len:694 (+),score=146.49 TRINITY_DN83177_c0_g1_i1:129-2210(+)
MAFGDRISMVCGCLRRRNVRDAASTPRVSEPESARRRPTRLRVQFDESALAAQAQQAAEERKLPGSSDSDPEHADAAAARRKGAADGSEGGRPVLLGHERDQTDRGGGLRRSKRRTATAAVKKPMLPLGELSEFSVPSFGPDVGPGPAAAVVRKQPRPLLPLVSSAPSKQHLQRPSPSGFTLLTSPQTAPARLSTATVKRTSMILEHEEGAQKLHDAYDVEEAVLGTGCFGTVRLATLRSAPSIRRAVKTVRKRNLKAESFVRQEIAILKQLDHPYICRLLETFEDHQSIHLVLEFVDGRELFDEIVEQEAMSESRAAVIMKQVLSALYYCHERGVLHRDLKPENIMVVYDPSPCSALSKQSASSSSTAYASEEDLDPVVVKVIDFGLAVISGSSVWGDSGSSIAGTPEFLAPEARVGNCLPASDIWSLGMVLHTLLTGDLPGPDILVGSERLSPDSPSLARISPLATDLLCGLLRQKPSERLTAAAAAMHPWVKHAGFREVPLSPSRGIVPNVKTLTLFSKSARLRQAGLTAAVMQLSDQQVNGLREQFIMMDTDGNGRISKEEFQAAVNLAVPELSAPGRVDGWGGDVQSWVDSVFSAVDTDGSAEIEYTEWLAAAQEGTELWDPAMRAAFRLFDSDGDGKIGADDLNDMINTDSPEERAALLSHFKSKRDGKLDFADFRRVLTGETESRL